MVDEDIFLSCPVAFWWTMRKRDRCRGDLDRLLDEFLRSGEAGIVAEYLVSNSNLPGPRANLELADAFVEAVQDFSRTDSIRLWNLCFGLTEILPDEAPVNDPKEFLPFCGAYAVGAIGSAHPEFFAESFSRLREVADDPRWRLREAVAKGIQKMIEMEPQRTLTVLEGWIKEDEWLGMRAVAAGVAEPFLLKNSVIAGRALGLHKRIFDRILAAKSRKSPEFRILRKGLGYTLSVVVCAVPKEGFRYMRQLVESKDKDVLWIVRQNLRKNRLMKSFPVEVDSTRKLLTRD